MSQGNSNYKPSRASKRGMLWASHGKRKPQQMRPTIELWERLNRRPERYTEWHASVIEAFAAARKRGVLRGE